MDTSNTILMICLIIIMASSVIYDIVKFKKNDGKIDTSEALSIISELNKSVAELVIEYQKLSENTSEETIQTEEEYIKEKMKEKLKLADMDETKAALVSQNLSLIIDYVLKNKDKVIKK